MEIQQEGLVLSIKGIRDLSTANIQALREAVTTAARNGLSVLEVDLSLVGCLDSAGLGVLVSLYKAAGKWQQTNATAVRLLDPQPAVQQLIELTRMHHLFEIVMSNLEDPEAELAGPAPAVRAA